MKVVKTILIILAIVLFIGFSILLIFCTAKSTMNTEVQTYTVGAEISHLDKIEKKVSIRKSETIYSMSVRNDDFATEFELTAEQYASYTVDEIVEVEVTEWENWQGEQYFTYKLIS